MCVSLFYVNGVLCQCFMSMRGLRHAASFLPAVSRHAAGFLSAIPLHAAGFLPSVFHLALKPNAASNSVEIGAVFGNVPHPLDGVVIRLFKDLEEANVQARCRQHRHLVLHCSCSRNRVYPHQQHVTQHMAHQASLLTTCILHATMQSRVNLP